MNALRVFKPGVVYFAGAGPGDVELLTLAAKRLIERADLILYAGSLVNPLVLDTAHVDAEIVNTAGMKLDDQINKMTEAAASGKVIARLHTGDPSIFGAIHEQMQALKARQIPYEVIPGVSSVFAAAAALGLEFTLPEITQTLVLTRVGGKTPVPEQERLRSLAGHGSSLAIFLSTSLIGEVVNELHAAGYRLDTPVAVVYRASWPDEMILRGTLGSIAGKMQMHALTRQALIILSPALQPLDVPRSHLYGAFQDVRQREQAIAVLALTAPAVEQARKIAGGLENAHLILPQKFITATDIKKGCVDGFDSPLRQVLQNAFHHYKGLVCVMAAGIVLRELAPVLGSKHSDPAVVVVDAKGAFAVSLLGGHEGGANDLARQVAAITGGQAVITTASDNLDLPALDVLAKQAHWKSDPRGDMAAVMAGLVNAESVALVLDAELSIPQDLHAFPWSGQYTSWQEALENSGEKVKLVMLTCHSQETEFWRHFPKAVVFYPPVLCVGVGCNRGTDQARIQQAVRTTLAKGGLALESVACLATIEDKADEAGLQACAKEWALPLQVYSREQIRSIEEVPNPSSYAMKALGVAGVSEPAALLAANTSTLLIEKCKFADVTVAIAMREGL